MAFSGYCLYDPQFPSPCLLFHETNDSSCSYSGSGWYFSADVPPPCPASDFGDLFASERTKYGSPGASFFGSSSWDWLDECYDRDELPHEDHENWIGRDDTHFRTCWEDYFPKFNDGFTGNSHLNAEQWTVDFPLNKSHINDAKKAGETALAPHSYDDTAPGYDYWLEQLWEEHYAQDQLEDHHSYADDYEFCSDIFGYWPCLSRRDTSKFL